MGSLLRQVRHIQLLATFHHNKSPPLLCSNTLTANVVSIMHIWISCRVYKIKNDLTFVHHPGKFHLGTAPHIISPSVHGVFSSTVTPFKPFILRPAADWGISTMPVMMAVRSKEEMRGLCWFLKKIMTFLYLDCWFLVKWGTDWWGSGIEIRSLRNLWDQIISLVTATDILRQLVSKS